MRRFCQIGTSAGSISTPRSPRGARARLTSDVVEQAEPQASARSPAAPVTYRRSGLAWALFSGVCWGAEGVVLGIALAMTPFVGAAALVAPLVAAALHDLLATGWM